MVECQPRWGSGETHARADWLTGRLDGWLAGWLAALLGVIFQWRLACGMPVAE